MLIKQAYVNISGINTRYWQAGQNGSSILCLHGLGASLEHWQYNITALANNYRVYAVDLIGFDRTYKPRVKYVSQLFTSFIYAFIRHFNMSDITLLGHSFGGGIALQLAIEQKISLQNLILVSSAGLGEEVNVWLRLLTLPIFGNWLPNPTPAQAEYILKKVISNRTRIKKNFITTICTLACKPGYKYAFFSTLRQHLNVWGVKAKVLHPLLKDLHKIKVPTLIIWGQDDPLLPVTKAYLACQRIKNSEYIIFNNCKHMPQLEHPNKFNEIITKFIFKNEALKQNQNTVNDHLA